MAEYKLSGPGHEAARLEALERYRVLDTPPEFSLDALTELAAEICNCPVALVSMIDERRQWFKSKYGLPAEFTECPRDITVCSSAICANDLLYVSDLTQDDRFRHLALVTGEPYLRFYCGMPLINRDGYALGTLCVVNFEPHELTPAQRESVRRLAQQAMAQLELRRQLIEREELLLALDEARRQAEADRQASEDLLATALPPAVARELRQNGRVTPRFHESVTILLADFAGFTRLTEGLDPAHLVEALGRHFARFDELAAANRLETLKTIGDAYLCAGGLPEANRTHAVDACLAALRFQKYIADANRQREKLRLRPWPLRIGINTGPLIAGVVGTRRLVYDVWGNAVNVAQRLEQACEPGRINISASTCHHVAALFETEPRGSVDTKNLGAIDMYFLRGIRLAYAADSDGTEPNDAFWKASGIAAVPAL